MDHTNNAEQQNVEQGAVKPRETLIDKEESHAEKNNEERDPCEVCGYPLEPGDDSGSTFSCCDECAEGLADFGA